MLLLPTFISLLVKLFFEVKNKTRALTIFLVLSLAGSLFFLPTSHALNESASAPVIIKLGNDKPIDYTVQEIIKFIPTASVVSINSVNALESKSQSFAGYIIYVGHGEASGLMIGNNLVSWSNVKEIMKDAPSQAYMLASCYSKSAEVEGKFTFGFQRQVDVDEAAMWAVMSYYSVIKQYDKIPEVINYFTSLLINKLHHPESNYIASLDYSSNSYWVDGWYWNKWSDEIQYPVTYTHLDVYNTWGYPWINLETHMVTVSSTGMIVAHIPKSTLDNLQLAPIIQDLVAGVGLVASVYAAILTGGISAIIEIIIAAFGQSESWIIDNYFRTETDDAWLCEQNVQEGGCIPWYYYASVDYKFGAAGWFTLGYYYTTYPTVFWQFFAYPDFYGGRELGIDGI